MIIYFANRKMEILGNASTHLPNGYMIADDLKTEDIETGVACFECKLPYSDDDRAELAEITEVGNYILRSHENENEFYTIIETETDTKDQTIYIYAEDAGLDLLNEIAPAYEATETHTAEWYVNKWTYDSGFEIGINEIPDTRTRKLSWDSEQTVTERLASIATGFGGFEVSYSFDIDGLKISHKYINIYEKRGKNNGVQLRLNNEVDRIVTTKSIANVATALKCTGGTPEKAETPITLTGYSYDDGDFFVDGVYLKSREALADWSRYAPEKVLPEHSGHIVQLYEYDTLSQATLCSHAIAELKKLRQIEVNYEVDIKNLTDGVAIGDRVNIIDDDGELYLSTRLLKLETSVANNEVTATLGEYLIKSDGISEKVEQMAADLAKNSASTQRANLLAYEAMTTATEAGTAAADAQLAAENAKTAADNAQTAANTAQTLANNAQTAADNAQTSANNAQTAANNAQTAVDGVTETVAGMQTNIEEAQSNAQAAKTAAETAQTQASEAKTASENATTQATEAKTAAQNAQTAAASAESNATEAKTTANDAKTKAEAAQTTVQQVKTDVESAQSDIAGLSTSLETLSTTMETDYAKKTEVASVQATLQTSIEQNAAQISSTATKLTEVDETANNAAKTASEAKIAANTAQSKADQAQADATAAQIAADNAKTAADNAQIEADNAKTAAAAAQSTADKAKQDLATAQANLTAVTSRVDATEEEIAAAQAAVQTAQKAADDAQTAADSAASAAATAQSTANTAKTNAATAQTKANEAASAAATAQATADAAKGDAETAQATADAAASAAASAAAVANTAKTNAEAAQTKANEAAANATAAQTAADEADAKAAQAAADLATAQQNLADVTSRVDATEQEIADAQTAVQTAQAAADKAKADAATAQSTADTAKANAATAQTAANNAKAAADSAQAAADAAQTAADNAQAAADALAVRVTSAETKITQNAEAIELRATKTEVAQTLGGYYTKEQTDSAIVQKADEITSTVSSTYATKTSLLETDTKAENAATAANNAQKDIDNLEIGGRNLFRYTRDLPIDYEYGEGIGSFNGMGLSITDEGLKLTFNNNTNTSFQVPLAFDGAVDNNETVTLSFKYRGNIESFGSFYFLQRNTPNVATTGFPSLIVSETEWQYYEYTFAMSDANIRTNYAALLFYSLSKYDNTHWVEIKKGSLKLEKGNRATDWTQALEDVDEEIDDVGDSVIRLESSIEQTAGAVVIEALSDYVRYDDVENEDGTVTDGFSSVIEALRAAITAADGRVTTEVANRTTANDGIQQQITEIRNRMDFDDSGLIFKSFVDGVESPYRIRITNDEMIFYNGITEVQRFDAQGNAKIPSLVVDNSMRLGGFALTTDSSGNLNLDWIGGN